MLYRWRNVLLVSPLKEKVAAYEKAKSVQLSHCNIKTVQVASKSIPLKTAKANENLVNYYITLSCVFDGKSIRIKEMKET